LKVKWIEAKEKTVEVGSQIDFFIETLLIKQKIWLMR